MLLHIVSILLFVCFCACEFIISREIVVFIDFAVRKAKSAIHNARYAGVHVMYEPNDIKLANKANPNYCTGDCSIRAISKIFNISWNTAFDRISKYAKERGCIPSTTWMIIEYFESQGYSFSKIANKWYRPDMTFGNFAKMHPKGKYAIFSRGHVAALVNGKIYDSWDSTDEKILYIMERIPRKTKRKNLKDNIAYSETCCE